MRRRVPWITLLLVCTFAVSGFAGRRVSIRLVEATNAGGGSTKGLEDVIGVLRDNLAFKSYQLLASGSQRLPAKGEELVLDGHVVQCVGGQHDLKIVVRLGKKVLLNTKVDLQDKKPVILGGFPSKRGKLVLIFLAR